jgi:hypothetical protein
MPDELLRIDLRCGVCSWAQECAEPDIVRWLSTIGMLKRDPQAEPAVLRELILAAAGRLTCPDCNQIGLIAGDTPEHDALWPTARRCAICGQPIPPERLEIFPQATTCVACQRADEQGRAPAPVEYCPKCGAPLVIRQTRGHGITRYTRACSGTPPCRL